MLTQPSGAHRASAVDGSDGVLGSEYEAPVECGGGLGGWHPLAQSMQHPTVDAGRIVAWVL